MSPEAKKKLKVKSESLIPWGIGFLVIIMAGVSALNFTRSSGGASETAPTLYTFDMIKFVDAQRPLAESSLSDDQLIFRRSSAVLEQTIKEIAGPNSIVLVKQAILTAPEESVVDITDQVLKKLGLDPEQIRAGRGSHMLTSQGRHLLEEEIEKEMRARDALESRSSESIIP